MWLPRRALICVIPSIVPLARSAAATAFSGVVTSSSRLRFASRMQSRQPTDWWRRAGETNFVKQI